MIEFTRQDAGAEFRPHKRRGFQVLRQNDTTLSQTRQINLKQERVLGDGHP